MLVVTRKVGEEVTIGQATVRVVRMERGRVRLGIVAPADVEITRDDYSPRQATEEAAEG